MKKNTARIQPFRPYKANGKILFGSDGEIAFQINDIILNSKGCESVEEWRVEYNGSGQGHYFAGIANPYCHAGERTGGPLERVE